MNLLGSPEFKVGVLVVVVSGLIGVMSLKVAQGPGVLGGQKEYWFEVPDAGGLVENSAVKMAGIKVGVIDEIKLKAGKARVHLVLDEDVPIKVSGRVEIRADGILGDKHVELIPGNLQDQPLKAGSEISQAIDKGSLEKLMAEVGNITDSLAQLAETLTRATQGSGDESTPIGRIVLNIEEVSKDLKEITGGNKEQINDIIDEIHRLSKNINQYLGPDTFSRVDTSLKNIEEITDKINSGEGTIGRLVNDEQTIEDINLAVENVNEFLGGARQMETSIDFHSEYLAGPSMSKSYLGFRIQPGLDRYYEIQVIDDPRGVVSEVERQTSVDDGPITTVDETKIYKSKVKFSALFAKNFWDFTIKGGIMENSGGLGIDYHLLGRKLKLSIEAFDFEDPYVRAFAKYSFIRGVYIIGGGDHLANEEFAGGFIGAGIFITNDDLKTLASRVSF